MQTYDKRRQDKAQENCQRDRYEEFTAEVERSNNQCCDSQINQRRTARLCELYLIGLFQLRIVFLSFSQRHTDRLARGNILHGIALAFAAGFNVPERKSFRFCFLR